MLTVAVITVSNVIVSNVTICQPQARPFLHMVELFKLQERTLWVRSQRQRSFAQKLGQGHDRMKFPDKKTKLTSKGKASRREEVVNWKVRWEWLEGWLSRQRKEET